LNNHTELKITLLFLSQIAFSAPTEKTVVDQFQETFTSVRAKTTEAVNELQSKILEATGTKTNEELLGVVQTGAENYGTQIKNIAEQISTQLSSNKKIVDENVSQLAKQLGDSASKLIGNNDPAKVKEIQSTFDKVLETTNTLNARLLEQG
jgi:hypothetical protein